MATTGLGLSTEEALERLHSTLKACIEEQQHGVNEQNKAVKFLRQCIECFGHSDRRNLVCLNYLILQILIWIALLLEICLNSGGGGLIFATIVFGILVVFNAFIGFRLHVLRKSELRRKAMNIIAELESMIKKITKRERFDDWIYADPFSPNSESITQQWALRETVEFLNSNKLINLPKILLVHGDVILLRPSKRTPCRVKTLFSSLQPQILFEYEKDQVFLPDFFDSEEKIELKKVAVKPFQPIYCEVQETPAVDYLKNCLDAGTRPLTVFEIEFNRVVHVLMENFFIPIFIFVYVFVGIFRCLVFPKVAFPLIFAIFWFPARILIPICGILVPFLTFFINFYGLSKILSQVRDDPETGATESGDDPGTGATGLDNQWIGKSGKSCLENKTESLELFTESTETAAANSPIFQNFSSPRLRKFFWSLLRGDPKYLPLSSNLVHCLGNMTSLDVVDKKGILSWPNAVPEKVFFFSSEPPAAKSGRPTTLTPRSLSCRSDSSCEPNDHDPNLDSYSSQIPTGGGGGGGVSEQVLDFTHEPDKTFAIMFDDPKWGAFLPNLKPIGLNVLLNGCKLNDYYMRFLDHLGVVSNAVPRTIAVANRRCLL